MTIDEFIEALGELRGESWEIRNTIGGWEYVRLIRGDLMDCPIVAVGKAREGDCGQSSENATEVGARLGLSDDDMATIISAADNVSGKGIPWRERNSVARRMLAALELD